MSATELPVAPPPPTAVVDPYAPPTAVVADPPPMPGSNAFYVVSSPKFWVLELATIGLYGIYWVYRHWTDIKRATRGDEWPVMRAIFQVFFIHSLATTIEKALRQAGIARAWAPSGVATGAVVFMIASNVLSRVPASIIGENLSFALGLAVIPVIAGFKWRIQLAANEACGDPAGRGNARFSGANIAWIIAFGLVWLLLLVGLVAVLAGV